MSRLELSLVDYEINEPVIEIKGCLFVKDYFIFIFKLKVLHHTSV